MLRNVYLEGELGDKFTPYLSMDCDKPAEVFTCLNANFPDSFFPWFLKVKAKKAGRATIG